MIKKTHSSKNGVSPEVEVHLSDDVGGLGLALEALLEGDDLPGHDARVLGALGRGAPAPRLGRRGGRGHQLTLDLAGGEAHRDVGAGAVRVELHRVQLVDRLALQRKDLKLNFFLFAVRPGVLVCSGPFS